MTYNPLLGLDRFSRLSSAQSVGLLGREISQSQGYYLPQDNINTIYIHQQTFMPRVGFELMTQGFERIKTVQAIGRTATVIGFGI
jgi:hypothetical protein